MSSIRSFPHTSSSLSGLHFLQCWAFKSLTLQVIVDYAVFYSGSALVLQFMQLVTIRWTSLSSSLRH